MDFPGIMDGVVASLLIFIGGLVIGWIKVRWPMYGDAILTAVLAAAGFAIILFTVTGRPIFSAHKPQTSENNVEENVKAWADKVGLGMKDISQSAKNDAYFLLEITLVNGNHVQVGRFKEKEREHYLGFLVPLELRPTQEIVFDKFSDAQKNRLKNQIILELGRARIGYSISLGSSPRQIILKKAIPISSNLAQDTFLATLDEMDSAISVVGAVANLELTPD